MGHVLKKGKNLVLIIRYFGASIIALFLLKIMRDPLPFDRTSMKSYLAGSLNLIGAQLFIYLAANYLTSGLMALIFGFSPLIAGLIGHVILKTQGREVPDQVFELAASLAAHYSRSQKSPKVEVDYLERKNVKKPAGAKPGFVVYYTNFSMNVEPSVSNLILQ